MVVRISDKTQNYSKVTKLLVKPIVIVIGDKMKNNTFFTTHHLDILDLSLVCIVSIS